MVELFKISPEEIEHCARILDRARGTSSPSAIEDVLNRLRPTLSKIHDGTALLEDIRSHLEMGRPEDAASLLRSHDRSRKLPGWISFLGKGKAWLWGGLPVGILVIVVAVTFAGGFMAKMDDAYEIAMKEINSCKAVTERLGEPIEQKLWGRAWGSSDTRGGQWGNAQWSIPVAGSKASGRYSYAAELHGGSWKILHASLDVGEDTIGVVPCGGEWLAKTIEAGKKSKPLYQSFGQVGTVAEASGRTSVKTGDSCEVSITPVAGFQKTSPYNCRVIVRCGPKVIYGWEDSGYTNCETDRGMPTRANDPWGTAKDTDPIVEVDLPSDRVVVRDDNPDSTYSIEIVWPAKGK